MSLRILCLPMLLALSACSSHDHLPVENYDRFYKFSPDLLPWVQKSSPSVTLPPEVTSRFRRECEAHWKTDEVMTRYCTTSRSKEYARTVGRQ
ncbi:MAG: hypothetical protein ACO4AU_13705 [bacterium]|jgi:hypothetical protein